MYASLCTELDAESFAGSSNLPSRRFLESQISRSKIGPFSSAVQNLSSKERNYG
jgi:hypothetical protein